MKILHCDFCGDEYLAQSKKRRHCSISCRVMDLAARFNGSIGCWEWPLSRNIKTGYGQLMTFDGKRTIHTAHRLSYEIFNGPIEGSLSILHRCDNRICFNPSHLCLGTQRDNIHDMIVKGRDDFSSLRPPKKGEVRNVRRGSSHPSAKIDEAIAAQIKAGIMSNSMAQVARDLKLPYHAVWSVAYGKWKHVKADSQYLPPSDCNKS